MISTLCAEQRHHSSSVFDNLNEDSISTQYEQNLSGCVAQWDASLLCASNASCRATGPVFTEPLCSTSSWLICPPSLCLYVLGSCVGFKNHHRFSQAFFPYNYCLITSCTNQPYFVLLLLLKEESCVISFFQIKDIIGIFHLHNAEKHEKYLYNGVELAGCCFASKSVRFRFVRVMIIQTRKAS